MVEGSKFGLVLIEWITLSNENEQKKIAHLVIFMKLINNNWVTYYSYF